MKKYLYADNIGMASSTLCLIHCLMTPFIFVAQACCTLNCCAASPMWWRSIDFIFLIISFIAVYFAGKNSSKVWVKGAFYTLFFLLTFLVTNHHVGVVNLPIYLNYGVAFLLFSLHLFNRKYCLCPSKCCAE